jgi:EAL domain-containing protein (putative c-di-GMP-specific phosphodiesterase class I)/FixJ family two-component response regulator
MSESLARENHDASDAGARPRRNATPLCFVVDEEPSICQFLSLALQGCGLDTYDFQDCDSFRQAMAHHSPDMVFLNVPLESGEVVAALAALGRRNFSGAVQLMSNRGAGVLEHVKNIGDQHGLTMLPALKKPFDSNTIIKIVQSQKLGDVTSTNANIALKDALQNGWIEFWYQPKVDLRRKHLAGVEAFARARHPDHGVLPPGCFMPGADTDDLLGLAELSLKNALRISEIFGALGINLRVAINIPGAALSELPIAETVQELHNPGDNWAGLILDVTEEEVVSDIPRALKVTKQLQWYNVKLAIDEFGRGYSSLAKLKELAFAELKLDRAFVTDCGTDRVNAPLCKTAIDLAHNFGAIAVAIGIEKASDVAALVAMGCDCGQGFLLGQPMPEERLVSLLRQRSQGRTGGAAASLGNA